MFFNYSKIFTSFLQSLYVFLVEKYHQKISQISIESYIITIILYLDFIYISKISFNKFKRNTFFLITVLNPSVPAKPQFVVLGFISPLKSILFKFPICFSAVSIAKADRIFLISSYFGFDFLLDS